MRPDFDFINLSPERKMRPGSVCKEGLKKMPAVNASEKAKEKAELGTRIASRLSLVRPIGLEPTRRMPYAPQTYVFANFTTAARQR